MQRVTPEQKGAFTHGQAGVFYTFLVCAFGCRLFLCRRGQTGGLWTLRTLIDKLHRERALSGEEWVRVIDGRTPQAAEHLFRLAREVRQAVYGKDVYIRGLIEFTNYCRNDCYYCGIRKSNPHVQRYRLSQDQILDCCRQGYELGFRTFVLQGGEDGWFTDERMVCLIRSIKAGFPDCALTLSIGERGHDSYQAFLTPERTATCCAMRPAAATTTESSIRRL